MKALTNLLPKSMPAQMIAVLALSFVAILAILTALEIADQSDLAGWAGHETTIRRLRQMKPALDYIEPSRRDEYLDRTSFCHQGYSVTASSYAPQSASAETSRIRSDLALQFGLDERDVLISRVTLTRDDFSYSKCGPSDIKFPVQGLVISVRLLSGDWLNAEIHPHEWHLHKDLWTWILRSGGVFLFIGAVALFFVHRLSRPLGRLTDAATRFGDGLDISEVEESGPTDLRRAVAAFNEMQRRVMREVQKRTNTLAAISHDVRSPLTALRIKAELIDDPSARADLVASIDKMEKITASALEFLRGESRNEPLREVDLAALLKDECEALVETGSKAVYIGPDKFLAKCRPEAISRAIRNLIENADKYAGGATVDLRAQGDWVEVVVADCGLGIPAEKMALALEPFERLSAARESRQGGFGLGLAIVKAICEGHEGELLLRPNSPHGLIVTMRLR